VDYNARWTFRGGMAWDQSPVPNAALRTPRLPDATRIWMSIGGRYRLSDRLSVDAGYSHLFIDTTAINRAGSTGGVLNGSYDSSADIFSLQLNYKYGRL